MRRVFILGRVLLILNAATLFGSVLFSHTHDLQATDVLTRQTAICVAVVLGMLALYDWPATHVVEIELDEDIDEQQRNELCLRDAALKRVAKLWRQFDHEGHGLSAGQIVERCEEITCFGMPEGDSRFKHDDMRDAIREFCPGYGGGMPTARSLANHLKMALKRRAVPGVMLASLESKDHALVWHIFEHKTQPA